MRTVLPLTIQRGTFPEDRHNWSLAVITSWRADTVLNQNPTTPSGPGTFQFESFLVTERIESTSMITSTSFSAFPSFLLILVSHSASSTWFPGLNQILLSPPVCRSVQHKGYPGCFWRFCSGKIAVSVLQTSWSIWQYDYKDIFVFTGKNYKFHQWLNLNGMFLKNYLFAFGTTVSIPIYKKVLVWCIKNHVIDSNRKDTDWQRWLNQS